MSVASMATVPQKALKKCAACDSLLPLSAFNRATKSRDGRAAVCRRCVNTQRRSTGGSRGKNEIRAAIKEGNIQRVRALFSGAPLAPNRLLAMAVQNYNTARKHAGHLEIVDFLIANGARPDCGMLFEAARDGSQALVDRLVAGGVELNIFASAVIGDLGRVANLLERDRRLARARTPLAIAHYQDFTPLHCCCLSGLGRQSVSKENQLREVGKLLVEDGAEIDAKGTFYGSLVVTPLDMVAHTGGNLSLSQFLISKGAKISSFAFAEALAHRGRSLAEGVALAELFLTNGFEINRGNEDSTALHGFANAGVPQTVQWLLDHGANVHARGRMGRTPLHLAAERNTSPKTVEILVAWGADMNAKDDQGLTALQVAELHGKTAVACWLRRALGQSSA
jgi:ankyrin repeat protein